MQVDGPGVWQTLRRMKDPVRHEDIVSMGLVRDVALHGGTVTIQVSPTGGDQFLDEALVDAIRREVGSLDGVDAVKIRRDEAPMAEPDRAVHLNVLGPQSGMSASGMEATGQVDFSDWGQANGPSSDVEIPQDRYAGWPPVFQWEVDPADPDIERGETEVVLGEWEYSVWWQIHPTGLVYASLQALREDLADAGPERPHPMGRNVAVNLVFDSRRRGIVAIYGTARDFRPFVEAFRQAFGITNDE